ncbi:MAG: protein translocase subunit SecD [FCB group bacterium]|nr:protein translocase subunit SecD [FCB group bacterium]
MQKSGKNRIIVELAGVKDAERARNLLQRTALLEFILVKNTEDFQQVLNKLDAALKESPITETDTTAVTEAEAPTDTTQSTDEVDELFQKVEDESSNELYTTSAEVLQDKPFSGYLKSFRGGYGVFAADVSKLQKLLDNDKVKKLIPRDGAFVWGNKLIQVEGDDGSVLSYKRIYYLNREAVLTGGVVTDARANLGGVGSNVSGQAIVNLTMNAEGSKTWARFTGANVGRNVAIVLDRKVYMAPVIRDRIPGGRTQISGLDDIDEAKDIANVLRAGKLPAPVDVVEERTVGPSLGHDSILAGTNAMFWGFLTVIIFMIFYYKGSGALADLSLLLNVFLVLGVLSMLKATLTLPGIAGLILTIGMAVDANVIIFERIREELDKGKTVKAAIDAGYSRAFITILDANITTLIAAFVLAWIGSGPIKGFAVTLSIGILASMFTAVFITRTIYMMFGKKKPIKVLSI